jgi:molybdopterin converting factor small subunit
MVNVRYFAAAAEAAGTESEQVEAATLGELLSAITGTRDARFADVLGQCSLLLDGRYVTDPATPLGAGTLDVLPPFAGG